MLNATCLQNFRERLLNLRSKVEYNVVLYYSIKYQHAFKFSGEKTEYTLWSWVYIDVVLYNSIKYHKNLYTGTLSIKTSLCAGQHEEVSILWIQQSRVLWLKMIWKTQVQIDTDIFTGLEYFIMKYVKSYGLCALFTMESFCHKVNFLDHTLFLLCGIHMLEIEWKKRSLKVGTQKVPQVPLLQEWISRQEKTVVYGDLVHGFCKQDTLKHINLENSF